MTKTRPSYRKAVKFLLWRERVKGIPWRRILGRERAERGIASQRGKVAAPHNMPVDRFMRGDHVYGVARRWVSYDD